MDKSSNTTKSVHLSASAGSGKTRALKDRYLALLDVLDKRGLNTDQAVAITFTDKAAAEIKERVMRDLPERMLKKIVRGRQDLRISTIHSFCMTLLKRYPLEAGLPPDFGVLDARDQAYKIQKAIEESLEESAPSVMAPLTEFTADELVSRLDFLLSIRSKLKRMEIDANGPAGLLREVRSGMDIDHAEAELQALIRSAEWRSSIQRMEQILRSQSDFYDTCMGKEHRQLADADAIQSTLRTAASLAPIYFNKDGSPCKKAAILKNSFIGKDREEYEKIFFSIQAMLETFQSLDSGIRAGREAISLLTLYQTAEEKYQASKLREGLLDFDDLEIYVYGLLQGLESPDILYWLDRKILHFLVDEFQDTSDIQWAILNKLTEEIFAGQGADKRMLPTLFVVGDEKQSIYRFREANYRLIESVKRKLEANLPAESREILTLDKNFRSTPEVIDAVNAVFGALWGASYNASEKERIGHKGRVRLIELTLSSKEEPRSPAEAEVLAREIKSLISAGTIVYEKSENQPRSPVIKSGSNELQPDLFSRDDQNISFLEKRGTVGFVEKGTAWTERPAHYGDCAILIQSRTRLKEYEAALQAENIPYRVIGGIGFYEEEEIQALMNVLFFLWNRDDMLSLAAALKSPLFGLGDRDIFDLMQDAESMFDGLKRQRPDAWKMLHGWLHFAGLVPLATLVHRIIEETGAYISFGRRNPPAVFNIDKLLDTAREFDRRGYTTLQDFVEWVRNIRRTEQREATADMNLPGFQGSVSIMTVHKAKGLEYPIVFLPGMNQQPKSLSTGPLAIVEDTGRTVRMAVKDSANPVYDDLWTREREELQREHQRLLYVAMTRARDHLIMIGTVNDGKAQPKKDSWLGYVHMAAPKPLFEFPVELTFGLRAYSSPRRPAEAGNSENTAQSPFMKEGKGGFEREMPEEIDIERVIENISPVSRSESPEWKKATDFIPYEESIEKLYTRQAEARIISPLTRGSVLHRCLEEFTKKGTYDIAGIIGEYPDILAAADDERQGFTDEIERVMNAALNKTGHAWIFERRPDSYAELPFLYKKGRALVSGVIDRVVIKGGKGCVIDYKAIFIEDDAALTLWRDHYRPQVQIYCEAIKEMFGLSSVEGYLLFLDSNTLAQCSGI